MNDWCKDYFDEWYGELILDTIPAEITAQQTKLLRESLELTKEKNVIDIGCGKGRHAIPLAKAGFLMTALDFSSQYLNEIKKQSIAESFNIRVLEQDMRSWNEPDTYHAAYMMFTSFGYFSDRENEDLVNRIALSLKKEGKFLLDIENRDYIIKFFIHEKWREKENGILLERHKFFPMRSQLTTKRIIINKDGEQKQSTRHYRLYSAHEIIAITQKAGLSLMNAMGDYSGIPFQINSPRILFVFKKK